MNTPQFLRRKEAAKYLRDKFGFGTERSLAKLACVGGGPEYRKVGERVTLYEPPKLDEWALSRIGTPQRSTSQAA